VNDVVDGEDVEDPPSRRSRRPRAVDGDDLVLRRDVLRHELEHGHVDFEVGEVDGGNAVLLGKEGDEIVFLEEPELRDVVAQPAAREFLLLEGPHELLFRDQVLLEEEIPDSIVHDSPFPWRPCPPAASR
jgi:hypothetical protein